MGPIHIASGVLWSVDGCVPTPTNDDNISNKKHLITQDDVRVRDDWWCDEHTNYNCLISASMVCTLPSWLTSMFDIRAGKPYVHCKRQLAFLRFNLDLNLQSGGAATRLSQLGSNGHRRRFRIYFDDDDDGGRSIRRCDDI